MSTSSRSEAVRRFRNEAKQYDKEGCKKWLTDHGFNNLQDFEESADPQDVTKALEWLDAQNASREKGSLYADKRPDRFEHESPLRCFTEFQEEGHYAIGKGLRPSLGHLVPYLDAIRRKEGWKVIQILEPKAQEPSFLFERVPTHQPFTDWDDLRDRFRENLAETTRLKPMITNPEVVVRSKPEVSSEGPLGWRRGVPPEGEKVIMIDKAGRRAAGIFKGGLWHQQTYSQPDRFELPCMAPHRWEPIVEPTFTVQDTPIEIPAGVYYSAESGNFYAMDTHKGQGNVFHRKWKPVARLFPGDPRKANEGLAPDNVTVPGPPTFTVQADSIDMAHDRKTVPNYQIPETPLVPDDAIVEDPINPKHYAGRECADIGERLSANGYQILKYCWRLGKKDEPCQELGKAIWYAESELALLTTHFPEGHMRYTDVWGTEDDVFLEERIVDCSPFTQNIARMLWDGYGAKRLNAIIEAINEERFHRECGTGAA